MDVMEKLVELLCEAQHIVTNTNKAEYLVEHGVTVQEWISVSEPPKEKGTYIVCTDKGGVLLGHWYGKEWNVGGGAKKHLAYWMKKPEPPKGERLWLNVLGLDARCSMNIRLKNATTRIVRIEQNLLPTPTASVP